MKTTVTVRLPGTPPPTSLTEQQLGKVGLKAVTMIQERTAAGKGLATSGELEAFKPYSENWFFIPLGALTGKQKAALEDLATDTNKAQIITRGDKLYALIHGYKLWKKAAYPDAEDGVNLSATGDMMNFLTVIRKDAGAQTVTLGWDSPELALRAEYVQHGRSPRRFLGLSSEESLDLARFAAKLLIAAQA